MRHCFYCGAELGRYREYDRRDHCGQSECSRAASDEIAAEQYEAHRQLDEDRGR
jgi:hypothetical protein